jgi:hypothetical protein
MNSKVWFLAAGKKKVGPMSTSRVIQRVAAGRVPAGTLAWKEGMDAWLPLEEIEDLACAETLVANEADARPTASKKKPSASDSSIRKVRKRKRSTKKTVKSIAGAEARHSGRHKSEPSVDAAKKSADEPLPLTYSPLYRIERKDVWRGFGLGLDRQRIKLTLGVFGLAAVVPGVILGIGAAASYLHLLLFVPFALVAGLVGYVLGSLGLGAVSYATRCQLEEQPVPSIREALGYAKQHAAALTVTPIALSLAWIVPLVALGVISALIKIPYLGPIGTGLLFGLHLALSAAAFFLILTAMIGALYTPVVVGFEGTGVGGTFRVLMDFVKRSTARLVLWGALPGLAQGPFSLLVATAAVLIAGVPLALIFAMAGGPEVGMWLSGAGEVPIGGLSVGIVPLGLWLLVFASGVVAILASVQNAQLGLLYLGGRAGNDELVSRDAYRERKAAAGEEG